MRATVTAARPNRMIPDDDNTFSGCSNVYPVIELPAMVSAADNFTAVLDLANDLIYLVLLKSRACLNQLLSTVTNTLTRAAITVYRINCNL